MFQGGIVGGPGSVTDRARTLDWSAIGVVVEPLADPEREEFRLGSKPQRRVERLGGIGLEADVLAGYLLLERADHRRRDALPSVRRQCPYVDQIGIADAVGEQAGHAY